MNGLAPVALFVYRRPVHTGMTVKALSECPEASRTDLVVYADGARGPEHRRLVEETRESVAAASGFRSVRIVERPQNLGLFQNIVSGLSEMYGLHEKVIVLEDDIQVRPDFLSFMNAALEHYSMRENVHSITGYLYPARFRFNDEWDSFLFPRFCCWGWATWRDRWRRIDWTIPERAAFLVDRDSFRQFWQASNDLPEIMLDLIEGKNNSWSILFNYWQVTHGGYCVYPTRTRVCNIGFDGSGTHSGRSEKFRSKESALRDEKRAPGALRFADGYDAGVAEPLRRYFQNGPRRRLKNLVRYGRFF